MLLDWKGNIMEDNVEILIDTGNKITDHLLWMLYCHAISYYLVTLEGVHTSWNYVDGKQVFHIKGPADRIEQLQNRVAAVLTVASEHNKNIKEMP